MSIFTDAEAAITGSPYALVAKLAGVFVVMGAVAALLFSWSARGQAITGLTNWQKGVTETTTLFTVQPDTKGIRKPLDPSQVVVALQTLHDNYQRDENMIADLSKQTAEAKARADTSDAALAKANVVMDTQFASSTKRIDALESAKANGTAADQCAVISKDSKAAWEGWK